MLVRPSNDGTQPHSTIFSMYIRANGKGGPGPVWSSKLNSMVECHLHLTLGRSRRWYSIMVQYHLRKGWPACSSKLDGTTLPSSPHSWSEPTPTLLAFNSLPFLVPAHCYLFLVSRLCAAHCCRLFSRTPKKGLQRR